jgi:Protein of unknown function (DUF4238)
MWTQQIQLLPIKNSFGAYNLYKSSTRKHNAKKNHIEKLFAKLEGATGAIIKKVEDVVAQSKDEPNTAAGAHLAGSEVYTLYKFIALTGFRNGLAGMYLDRDDEDLFGPTQTIKHGQSLDMLDFFLQKPHQKLVEMDEHFTTTFRPNVARSVQVNGRR